MIVEIFLILILVKLFLSYMNRWCTSKVCLVGKTALITGGNSGLGLETAKYLASRGCKVIIADKDDARYTAIALQKETHNPDITSIQVDLSSFDSVRNFGRIINSTVNRLDILINAASISSDTDTVNNCDKITKDGLQRMMQVNYFSHFLLVHLLADLLRRSAPCRILHSSSISAYLLPHLTPTDLINENENNCSETSTFKHVKSHIKSQLSVAIASKIFADKFRGTGVTSNCFCPGLVKKKFAEKAFKAGTFVSNEVFGLLVLTSIFGKTIDHGCQPVLHLSIADEVRNTTGKFFWESSEFPQPAQTSNDEFCNEFWKLSEETVGLTSEDKLDVILENAK